MSNSIIGRNPQIARWINWASLFLGGLIFFVNIHFSAVAMQAVAQGSVGAGFVPVAASSDWAGMASRYITAFAVSFACLVISGCFLHPRGLPTVFSELRQVEARGASKGLAMAITILAVAALAYGGFWAYRYDLMTTALAFGVGSIWSVAAFPVWLNVVGPEFFFHATHFYGRLNAGPAPAMPSMPTMPTMPTMPAMPTMPTKGGGKWDLKK